ncbi:MULTISPECIES: rhomboid family intramembrane serine protease [Oleiagrimonas]|jgi:membrane associated rhomboid family serine protease|uniref:Rhomboid family intramembrane serine protease n=1 Tax=Oleiagrimonas citrea TaxID=1665687 RepID=A0A846ZIZ9_9GAMM|nr:MULTISPECIES: rhomboid family intramembrane serine protease [Oleiagrimonas]NKZ37976.1 rhomboid family intramembrane serine protease [Oleiagrimonas citrea]RAP57464.1 rhomboid family intramembrane serine protease [Oleiagrimonas sp. MCCC 1A03011]
MSFDLPKATRALLIANVAVFLLQLLAKDNSSLMLSQYFALWPLGPEQTGMTPAGNVVHVGFQVWQLVTYGFLHGGVMHILLNMYGLFLFGGAIERTLGTRNFVIYYFVCMIVAALAQLAVVHFFTGGFYPTIGASGAIFGILLAFGMMFPHERLLLIFPPIELPAWMFVTGYGAIELIQGVLGTQAGIAHFAHLGGMLGGFLLIQYWRGKFPIKPKRRLMR